jgi:hypothetical protein
MSELENIAQRLPPQRRRDEVYWWSWAELCRAEWLSHRCGSETALDGCLVSCLEFEVDKVIFLQEGIVCLLDFAWCHVTSDNWTENIPVQLGLQCLFRLWTKLRPPKKFQKFNKLGFLYAARANLKSLFFMSHCCLQGCDRSRSYRQIPAEEKAFSPPSSVFHARIYSVKRSPIMLRPRKARKASNSYGSADNCARRPTESVWLIGRDLRRWNAKQARGSYALFWYRTGASSQIITSGWRERCSLSTMLHTSLLLEACEPCRM